MGLFLFSLHVFFQCLNIIGHYTVMLLFLYEIINLPTPSSAVSASSQSRAHFIFLSFPLSKRTAWLSHSLLRTDFERTMYRSRSTYNTRIRKNSFQNTFVSFKGIWDINPSFLKTGYMNHLFFHVTFLTYLCFHHRRYWSFCYMFTDCFFSINK